MYDIQIEILADGTIKAITDGVVPEEHHKSADELLTFIAEKTGGERNIEKLREGHIHTHNHGHAHHHH